jgi:hypothetical protein
MHGRKKKSPIAEPGLNLFSEENRGDRCNYAARRTAAIIEKSNVRYNGNAYFAATLISSLTTWHVCAASSRAQSKGRMIHDFVLRRSAGFQIGRPGSGKTTAPTIAAAHKKVPMLSFRFQLLQ